MHDEVLGLFHCNNNERYEKTFNWLGKTIYLTFYDCQAGDAEKSIAILRELCSNQKYWDDIFTSYIVENHKRYDKTSFKKEDLRLLDIFVAGSKYKHDELDGDFSFHFYDLTAGEGAYFAIIVEGTLEKGAFGDIETDWYWRGKLLDGLLNGETEPDMKITVTSVNPMPYTGTIISSRLKP